MHKLVTALGLGLLLAAWAAPVGAVDDSTRSAARQLAKEAKHDFDAGRFTEASRKFQQAFAATQVPTLALWSARSLAKQGQLVAASEFYLEATRLQKNELWLGQAQEAAQRQAAAELQQLLPRLAQLTITVTGASSGEVDVKVDAVPVPAALLGAARPTDPGQRRIVARRDAEEITQEVTLREGEKRTVELQLTPKAGQTDQAPPALAAPLVAADSSRANRTPPGAAVMADDRHSTAGNGWRTVGWLGLGLGATGVAVGVVSGLVVMNRYGDYKSSCPANNCDLTVVHQNKLDSYNSWRTVSTVSLIGGAAFATAGVTLLLTQPTHSRTQLGLQLAPSMVAVRGAF